MLTDSSAGFGDLYAPLSESVWSYKCQKMLTAEDVSSHDWFDLLRRREMMVVARVPREIPGRPVKSSQLRRYYYCERARGMAASSK